MTVWTIGHGTRGVDELIGVLAAHRIARLVDVRTVPRSRHNPQFNRDRMPGDLERAGIIYVHMPGLGGLRQPRPDSVNTSWRNSGFRGYADYMQTPEFQTNLDALLRQARGGPTAISSASRNPNGVGARGSWATSAGLEIQARIILRLVCTYEGHIDMEIAVRCPRGQRGQ